MLTQYYAQRITRWSVVILPVALMISLSCSGTQSSPQTARTILQDAIDYLIQEQGTDGGWHSPTHGFVRSGQAWTPFVIYQLAVAKEHGVATVPERSLQQGAAFIRAHVTEEGILGIDDPDILEYPNYSTSYALRALLKIGSDNDDGLLHKMAVYLLAQQYDESRGIDSSNVAYGSWGFGEKVVNQGRVGHVDLSHTRRVAEALNEYASERPQADLVVSGQIRAALTRAQVFLGAAQKHPTDERIVAGTRPQNEAPYDGGFYSSPVVHGTNKAGSIVGEDGSEYFVSYATTTCDGLLTLLATGATVEDERVLAATEWLVEHQALDRPQGITPGQPGDWERVMLFYHLASRAQVYGALNWTQSWRQEMTEIVRLHQQEDGSFSNPDGALNKEDDPILATTLVIEALTISESGVGS